MRWQRVARAVVAVIGLSCAAAVYLLTRPAPDAPPKEDKSLVSSNPDAVNETGKGMSLRLSTVDGKERGKIYYDSSQEFADGRKHFTKIKLVDTLEGTEVAADQADMAPLRGGQIPPEVVLTGHVTMTRKDGVTIRTDKATYDDALGVMTAPGPVTFSRGRMTGEGVGATFERTTDLVTILDKAHMVVTPGPDGKGAIDAVSRLMRFARREHSARFEGSARIVKDGETLSGDTALFMFTEDEERIRAVDLRGNASVVPPPDATGGPPQMRADDITLILHPDGRTVSQATLVGRGVMEVITAEGRRAIAAPRIFTWLAPDGSTVTRLDARDGVVVDIPPTKTTPLRKITATTLAASGNEKEGLKMAVFDGGAVFTETPAAARGQTPANRVGRSRSLQLILKGQLDAIEQANFIQNVTFEDAEMTATADRAEHRMANDRLVLLSDKGSKTLPRAVTKSMSVVGQWIDLNTKTQDVDAKGDVQTEMTQSSSATSKGQSAFFDRDKPIIGRAAAFQYRKDSGQARYTGTPTTRALVRQEQNSVEGDEVTVWEKDQNLRAVGHVETKMLMVTPPAGRAASETPQRTRVTAQELDYRDATRTATYLSDKANPDDRTRSESPDGVTTSRLLVMTLAATSRTAERVTWEGDVDAKLTGRRWLMGPKLVYDAPTGLYTLSGNLVRAIVPDQDDPKSCSRHTGTKFVYNQKTGESTGENTTITKEPCPSFK